MRSISFAHIILHSAIALKVLCEQYILRSPPLHSFLILLSLSVRRELQLTPPHNTHHRHTKHMLPHDNNAVFINILNILRIEYQQLNEEINEEIPNDGLKGSKHVGLFLIKVF